RMIPSRQAVHCLPRKKCGERGEEHGQLKHDWEKRGNGPKIPRLAMHIDGIEKPGGAKFDEGSGEKTRNSAEQYPAAQPRLSQSHAYVHSMDRKPRGNVP